MSDDDAVSESWPPCTEKCTKIVGGVRRRARYRRRHLPEHLRQDGYPGAPVRRDALLPHPHLIHRTYADEQRLTGKPSAPDCPLRPGRRVPRAEAVHRPGLAATSGAEVIDPHALGLAARSAGTEASLVGDDGFHPSTAGYQAVAGAFAVRMAALYLAELQRMFDLSDRNTFIMYAFGSGNVDEFRVTGFAGRDFP